MISPVIGDAGNVPTVVTKGNGANPSIICSSCKYGGGRREEMPEGKTRSVKQQDHTKQKFRKEKVGKQVTYPSSNRTVAV